MPTHHNPSPEYQLAPYTFDRLLEWLSDESVGRTIEDLRRRVNVRYFEEYLNTIISSGSGTMIMENEYIDSDYLKDYSAYYAKCFSTFSKFTRRIHFFDVAFSDEEFSDTLTNENSTLRRNIKAKPENYLGFIVVKPLPRTFIGKTCLRTYQEGETGRHYTIKHAYPANLFGLKLEVDSLAFQEQDNEVAACATSALWSLFHGSSRRFGNAIPSPHAITLAATTNIPDWLNATPDVRRFPNSGLSPAQISSAIRSLDLEAYLIGSQGKSKNGNANQKVSRRAIINIAAYAYLSSRIPVLMFCKLKETKENSTDKDIGFHAITLTGFSIDGAKVPRGIVSEGGSEITFRPMRIKSFYVHDDQIGPFARMEWLDDDTLSTSWHCLEKRQIQAIPDSLIIPLTSKIRIPYDTVEKAIVEINQLINLYVKQRNGAPVEWEIRLDTVNNLKAEIIDDPVIVPEERKRLLTRHMPKHLWRAIAWLGGKDHSLTNHLEFLVDATALQQEGGLVDVITRNDFLVSAFAQSLQQPTINASLISPQFSPLTRQICRVFQS